MAHIHCIGIGGIGVSALARAFLHDGWTVSGSNIADSALLNDLREAGITVHIGHNKEHLPQQTEKVVRSLAVNDENPEVQAAHELGIPVMTYAEALGEFAQNYKLIAIAGMHGKSTTTAMLAQIMVEAGLDPTVIVGTKLQFFGGSNFRAGNSEYLLIEADEYGRSFLQYHPWVAAVLNIEPEHLDVYDSLNDIVSTFGQFISQIKADGTLVYNGADEQTVRLAAAVDIRTIRFGEPQVLWELAVPGAHNQANAEAAWKIAETLGIERSAAERALAAYMPAWRRLEQLDTKGWERGQGQEVVYSDYAHHPTEVRAALSALRAQYPDHRLLVVFQPHQIERLTNLFDDFTGAFERADEAWILPAYEVVGREYAGAQKRTGRELADAISHAHYFATFEEVVRHLEHAESHQPKCIVFMGAGDIDAKARRMLGIL